MTQERKIIWTRQATQMRYEGQKKQIELKDETDPATVEEILKTQKGICGKDKQIDKVAHKEEKMGDIDEIYV